MSDERAPEEKAATQKWQHENISYGLHTLPKKFWTIEEGKNLLNDKAFLARRTAKNARHLDNIARRAEENRGRKR